MSAHSEATSRGPPPIRQTYGQPRVTSGFPACRLSTIANAAQTTFADLLLCAGHGYPLLQPNSQYADDPEQDEVGLRLGDVGYTDGAGCFISLFNIFQTKRTDRSLLPKHYQPIQPGLSEWDVQYTPQYFPPGTILAGRGIEATLLSSSPLKLKVTTQGTPGGIIALPEGASRQDLVNVDALRPYVELHALDWYQFANSYTRDPSCMTVPNGSLHLITGVDVAPRWATGIVRYTTTAEFEYHGSGNDWYPRDAVREDNYSSMVEVRGNIFIRGLRVALGSALWDRYMPRIEPRFVPVFALLTRYVDADLPIFYRWKLKAHKILMREQHQVNSRRPDRHPAHPSLILLQAMLVKAPSANVLIVHDSTWSALLEISLQYPSIFDLILRILDDNVIKIIDGVAVLMPDDRAHGSLHLEPSTRLARVIRFVFGTPKDEDTRRCRRLDLWRAVHQVDPI